MINKRNIQISLKKDLWMNNANFYEKHTQETDERFFSIATSPTTYLVLCEVPN
jgi:hypothetical protein